MMRVTINSRSLPEPIPFYLDEGLVGSLATKEETKDFLPYRKENFEYLLKNEKILSMCTEVAKETGESVENVLHLMLKGICFVDRKGRKYLNLEYKNEEDFSKVWEKFLKRYRAKEEINYMPFVIASALILAIFESIIPKTDYIMEPNLLQYILPMERDPKEIFQDVPEGVKAEGIDPTEFGPEGSAEPPKPIGWDAEKEENEKDPEKE